MSRQARWFRLGSMLAMLSARPAVAHPLLGGTAAVETSPFGAAENPANAAFAKRSEIALAPQFAAETFRLRYPGFDPMVKSQSRIDWLSAVPKAYYKLSPDSTVGISEILPPWRQRVNFEAVPLMLLGQPNRVDIAAEGESRGGLNGFAALLLSKSLAVGVDGGFRSLAATVHASATDGGAQLVDANISDFSARARVGARLNLGLVNIGARIAVLSYDKRVIDAVSSLVSTASEPVTTNNMTGLNNILVGASLRLGLLTLLLDIEYAAASKNTKDLSAADLREKPKDSYSTLGVRSGLRARLSKQSTVLAGARYEPAAVGAGGRGEGSLGGFGMTETFLIYAGLAPLLPYYQVGAGIELSHAQWRFAGGFTYREATLGIDEAGEQPAAYFQKQFALPVVVSYRL